MHSCAICALEQGRDGGKRALGGLVLDRRGERRLRGAGVGDRDGGEVGVRGVFDGALVGSHGRAV